MVGVEDDWRTDTEAEAGAETGAETGKVVQDSAETDAG